MWMVEQLRLSRQIPVVLEVLPEEDLLDLLGEDRRSRLRRRRLCYRLRNPRRQRRRLQTCFRLLRRPIRFLLFLRRLLLLLEMSQTGLEGRRRRCHSFKSEGTIGTVLWNENTKNANLEQESLLLAAVRQKGAKVVFLSLVFGVIGRFSQQSLGS